MLQMALRQAVELGSFVRAARNFSELTGVPISDSSLQRLVVETGTTVVQADAQEAEAMVCVAKEEEGVTYRRIPEPDSEVMALSADGVMVHLREEGWKGFPRTRGDRPLAAAQPYDTNWVPPHTRG